MKKISPVLILMVAVIFLVPQCLFAQAPPPTSQQQQIQTTAPVKAAATTKSSSQNQTSSASGQIQSPNASAQTTTQFMTSSSPLTASAPQPVKQTAVTKSNVSQAQPLNVSQKLTSTSVQPVAVTGSLTRKNLQRPVKGSAVVSPAVNIGKVQPVAGTIPAKSGLQTTTAGSVQPISGQIPVKGGQQAVATVGSVQTISGAVPSRITSQTAASTTSPVPAPVIQFNTAAPLQPAPGLIGTTSPTPPTLSLAPSPAPAPQTAAPLTQSAPSPTLQSIAIVLPTQFPSGFLPKVKGGDDITKGIQNYWANIGGIQPGGTPQLISAAQTIFGGYNISISVGNPATNYFDFKLVNQNGIWLVTESVQLDDRKNLLRKEKVDYDRNGDVAARKTDQYFQGQLSSVYERKYDRGQLIFESENLIGSAGQSGILTTKEYSNGQLIRERQDYTDVKGQKTRAFEKLYQNGLLAADFYADNAGLKSLTLKQYDKQGNVARDEKWFPVNNGNTIDNYYTLEQTVPDPNVPGGQYSTFVRFNNGKMFSFNIAVGNTRITAGLTANGWVNYSPGANNAVIRDIDQFIADSTAKLQVPSTVIDLNQKVPAFPRGFTL